MKIRDEIINKFVFHGMSATSAKGFNACIDSLEQLFQKEVVAARIDELEQAFLHNWGKTPTMGGLAWHDRIRQLKGGSK